MNQIVRVQWRTAMSIIEQPMFLAGQPIAQIWTLSQLFSVVHICSASR